MVSCGSGMWWVFRVLFFFQAEDGIRDLTVTGVQTCALPISKLKIGKPGSEFRPFCAENPKFFAGFRFFRAETENSVQQFRFFRTETAESEIGRASCRERV